MCSRVQASLAGQDDHLQAPALLLTHGDQDDTRLTASGLGEPPTELENTHRSLLI